VTLGGSAITLSYDADGNLIAKDGVSYSYNAENRLISVQPQNPVDGDTKVAYTYDYMGRRVKKAASTFSSGS